MEDGHAWVGSDIVVVGASAGGVGSAVLDAGASGLVAVARSGGAALVQSASDALYPTMPAAAMELVESAFVGTTAELAQEIVTLAGNGNGNGHASPVALRIEQ